MKAYSYYVHVVNQPQYRVLDATLGPYPTRRIARSVARKNRDALTAAYIEKRGTTPKEN